MVQQFDLTNEGLDKLNNLKQKVESGDPIDSTSILDRVLRKKVIPKNAIDYFILTHLNDTPQSVEDLKGKLVRIPSADSSFYSVLAERIGHLQREHMISPVESDYSSRLGPFGKNKSKSLCTECSTETTWDPLTSTYSCNCGRKKLVLENPKDFYNRKITLAREEKERLQRATYEEQQRQNRPGLTGGSS